MLSVPLTKALVMSLGFAVLEAHMDVTGLFSLLSLYRGLCCHPEPFICQWLVLPPIAILMSKGQTAGQELGWSEWHMQPPGATLMSPACAAAEGHVWVSRPDIARGLGWSLWPVLPPKVKWISIVCAVYHEVILISMGPCCPQGHVDVSGLCCHLGSLWCLGLWSYCSQGLCWLMIMACVTTKGHVDVLGLCCNLKPCWCPWCHAVTVDVNGLATTWGHGYVWIHTAAKGHVWGQGPTASGVCGPCYHWKEQGNYSGVMLMTAVARW